MRQDFGCETKEGYSLEAVGKGVQTIEWTWKKWWEVRDWLQAPMDAGHKFY